MTKRNSPWWAMLAALVLLPGCKKPEAASTANVAVAADVAPLAATAAAKPVEFDINTVSLSTVALGDFPYISLPQGYMSNGKPETKKFSRFPFWVKGAPHWVEGRFYLVNVYPEKEGDYSPLEVRKNLDALVAQMGGVKVSEEKIPYDTVKGWGDEIAQGFITGLGDVYSLPVVTYVVHRTEGNLWIHFCQGTSQAGIIVGQEKAFEQTAKLLPASELKKQIDANGKVALQVNFATDETDILPDSQLQIAQVVQLLKEEPSLHLDVNGHTDNTGDAAHNQSLSEGRAKAVVAALEALGIDAKRLSAHGHGASQPVADNGSEEGKAKNRRVELVKR